MYKKRTFFISLIFFVTIACVLPGLSSTPATPIFAPTIDTGAIEMRVVGTVSAALAQTEQAQPTVTSTFPATPPSISTHQRQQRRPPPQQTHLKAHWLSKQTARRFLRMNVQAMKAPFQRSG